MLILLKFLLVQYVVFEMAPNRHAYIHTYIFVKHQTSCFRMFCFWKRLELKCYEYRTKVVRHRTLLFLAEYKTCNELKWEPFSFNQPIDIHRWLVGSALLFHHWATALSACKSYWCQLNCLSVLILVNTLLLLRFIMFIVNYFLLPDLMLQFTCF